MCSRVYASATGCAAAAPVPLSSEFIIPLKRTTLAVRDGVDARDAAVEWLSLFSQEIKSRDSR